MARRSLLGFIFLNIVVTFLVTGFILLASNQFRQSAISTPAGGLLRVIITTTPDPNQTPQVIYIVVTATPQSIAGLSIPTQGTPSTADATFDPSQLPASLGSVEAPTLTPTDPSGCPVHTVESGDVPVNIARRYSVSLADLLRANGLDEDSARRLRPGQKLIIPVEGCGLPTETPTLTPTNTREVTVTPTETPTEIPVVANAKIEVMQIINAGDVTTEGIEIRNMSDGLIEIGGWTMSDQSGNTYTFPNYQMYPGRRVIVYTRADTDTPFALFWGRARAVWGDPTVEITFKDANGDVQLVYSPRNAPAQTATPG